MAARVLTSLAHGTFFGVGSVVATGLVAPDKRASAIAIMFTGLTVANILGVPFGTWLGQHFGWRATFWAVTVDRRARLRRHRRLRADETGTQPQARRLRADLSAMLAARRCCSALLTTVLGFAGVFAVFTYIAPIADRDHRLSAKPRCRRSCWCSAAGWWSATCSAASWPTAT